MMTLFPSSEIVPLSWTSTDTLWDEDLGSNPAPVTGASLCCSPPQLPPPGNRADPPRLGKGKHCGKDREVRAPLNNRGVSVHTRKRRGYPRQGLRAKPAHADPGFPACLGTGCRGQSKAVRGEPISVPSPRSETLGKSRNRSVPCFPHLENGDITVPTSQGLERME